MSTIWVNVLKIVITYNDAKSQGSPNLILEVRGLANLKKNLKFVQVHRTWKTNLMSNLKPNLNLVEPEPEGESNVEPKAESEPKGEPEGEPKGKLEGKNILRFNFLLKKVEIKKKKKTR